MIRSVTDRLSKIQINGKPVVILPPAALNAEPKVTPLTDEQRKQCRRIAEAIMHIQQGWV